MLIFSAVLRSCGSCGIRSNRCLTELLLQYPSGVAAVTSSSSATIDIGNWWVAQLNQQVSPSLSTGLVGSGISSAIPSARMKTSAAADNGITTILELASCTGNVAKVAR